MDDKSDSKRCSKICRCSTGIWALGSVGGAAVVAATAAVAVASPALLDDMSFVYVAAQARFQWIVPWCTMVNVELQATWHGSI